MNTCFTCYLGEGLKDVLDLGFEGGVGTRVVTTLDEVGLVGTELGLRDEVDVGGEDIDVDVIGLKKVVKDLGCGEKVVIGEEL